MLAQILANPEVAQATAAIMEYNGNSHRVFPPAKKARPARTRAPAVPDGADPEEKHGSRS